MPKRVDHEQRRRQVVEAIWGIVSEDGFAAVSVRSIADRTGLARNTISRLFPTRTSMLSYAVEASIGAVQQRVQQVGQLQLNPGTLMKIVMTGLPMSRQRRQQATVWMALLEAAAAGDPEAKTAMQEFNAASRESIRNEIQRAQKAGLIPLERDLDQETNYISAVVDGISVQLIAGDNHLTRPAITAIVEAHIRHLTAI